MLYVSHVQKFVQIDIQKAPNIHYKVCYNNVFALIPFDFPKK